MEEEVGRPSYDAAAVVTGRDVAGMEKFALGMEGRHKLVAFAPELGCTCVHVGHDFVMTQLMRESWIVGCDRPVVDIVFAAGGQPPLDRVLLVHLVRFWNLDVRKRWESPRRKMRTCG